MMRPDNGRVDHLHGLANALGLVQGFQKEFPQPTERPAPELSIDRRPFAEMFVQVPPLRPGAGDPENPVENEAVVLRRSPAMRAANCDEGLEAGPFRIAHQSQNQVRLLPKATLNQKLDQIGILFVNAT
jgi:hypothetical protein